MICLLCGKDYEKEQLTKEHIPPQSLFPKPKPNNLFTIQACKKCNNDSSKDDEYFKTILQLDLRTYENKNIKGKLVNKSIRSLTRIQGEKFAKKVLAGGREIELKTPSGIYYDTTLQIPKDINRINKVIEKIIKGLSYNTNKKYLNISKIIIHEDTDQLGKHHWKIDFLNSKKFKHFFKEGRQIGDGSVFKYKYCMDPFKYRELYLICFYESIYYTIIIEKWCIPMK